jgi:hypothetical protein
VSTHFLNVRVVLTELTKAFRRYLHSSVKAMGLEKSLTSGVPLWGMRKNEQFNSTYSNGKRKYLKQPK